MAKGLVLNIDTTKSEFQNPMVELRQGDGNYQSLTVTVTSNGEPLDLTGWTTAFMGTTAGNHKIVDANVQVDNTQQGVFTYTPTKAWGQDIGEFSKAYFKFSKDDQSASGANFRVKVFEAVDLTEEEAGNYISVVDVMIDKIKTDMDNKLADTQTTLTNTQSQANTVQTNVDDLNTNVNQLKSQNNNIKISDNTWSGNNTFSLAINGKFSNKILSSGTDLYTVIEPGFNYISQNVATTSTLKNVPNGVTLAFGLMTYDLSGYTTNSWAGTKLVLTEHATGNKFFAILSRDDKNIITVQQTWQKFAKDATVVHNNGNETINGNKTFTSPINGSLSAREAQFTDFIDVAKNMIKYAGIWFVRNTTIKNSPVNSYYSVVVTSGISDGGSGYIIVTPFNSNWQGQFISTVGSGTLGSWNSFAVNESVVHNSGNETINGVKTFGSNIVQPKTTATVNFQNGFTAASVPLVLTRVGNMVSLTGRMLPNTILNKDAITTAFTIPQGFKPSNQFGTRQAGAYGYNYLGEFYPDGHFEFSAYSNNGTYVQPSNNEIHVNATWLTFD